MPNIAKVCNQSARYEKLLSTDEWGNATYDKARTIRVRMETQEKRVREDDEIRHITVTKYLTPSPTVFTIGDLINGEVIQGVKDIVAKNGSVIGWYGYPSPPSGLAG